MFILWFCDFCPYLFSLFVSGNEIGFLRLVWPFGLLIYLNFVPFSRFLSKVWSYQIKKSFWGRYVSSSLDINFWVSMSFNYCFILYLAAIVSFFLLLFSFLCCMLYYLFGVWYLNSYLFYENLTLYKHFFFWSLIGLLLHIILHIKAFSRTCSPWPNSHILCWISLSLYSYSSSNWGI